MVHIDETEEIVSLSREVRGNIQLLMQAVNDRAFFDIGYEVGNASRGALGFDHLVKDLEQFEGNVRANTTKSFDDTYGRIYDLVNFYDHLIEVIRTNQEHFRKGEGIAKNLVIWRNTAGRLAQIICQMCESD